MYSYLFWTPINKISFTLNGIIYGKNLKCRGKIYTIFHSEQSKLEFGDCVFINSGDKQNPIGCGTRTYFQLFDEGKIQIGNGTGISNAAFTCYENICIGDHVMIGAGCKFYDTDFHPLDYKKRVFTKEKPKTAPIIVEEGVFIGAGSYILKGVTIGKHSIVGAGSVVSKNIPANQIWAGAPARYIKNITE